jgi:hypothetical protein
MALIHITFEVYSALPRALTLPHVTPFLPTARSAVGLGITLSPFHSFYRAKSCKMDKKDKRDKRDKMIKMKKQTDKRHNLLGLAFNAV